MASRRRLFREIEVTLRGDADGTIQSYLVTEIDGLPRLTMAAGEPVEPARGSTPSIGRSARVDPGRQRVPARDRR
jgi:hypothetical protein